MDMIENNGKIMENDAKKRYIEILQFCEKQQVLLSFPWKSEVCERPKPLKTQTQLLYSEVGGRVPPIQAKYKQQTPCHSRDEEIMRN